jgi:hypothetical protein
MSSVNVENLNGFSFILFNLSNKISTIMEQTTYQDLTFRQKVQHVIKKVAAPIDKLRKRLMNLEIRLSVLLLFTPGILIALDGSVRSSISNYAYSHKSEWFVFLITLAASMFIYNGTAWRKKWYNIVLGIILAGIVLTPHKNMPVTHQVLAVLFFAGSVFVMIYFSSKKQRIFKVLAGLFLSLGISGFYFFNWYSLFWAEWIGIVPICVHFVGESLGKID